MAIPCSNVVDLVHDLLRKRKTSDPIGWQQFASQMHAANIPMELVGNVARRQHIQKRTRIPTVGGPNQQWQADLVDMSRLKKSNEGTTFLLTVIDVFSKWAWCIPLKNKSAASLVAAFKQLLRERSPLTLQTDKGSEF